MQNTIVWYDVPVKDLERAKKFYETIFEVSLQVMENGPNKIAMFPFGPGVVGASLVDGPNSKPNATGGLIYFNGGEDLSLPLAKVQEAGGTVVMEKTSMGDHGFSAQFKDTEGNVVALHSPK